MSIQSLVNRLFSRDDNDASKHTAKERLRLVLVHDRLDISEKVMNSLRIDLLNVIGKYFGIDEKELDVSFSRESGGIALVANIPVSRGNAGEEEKPTADAKAEEAAPPPKPTIMATSNVTQKRQVIPEQTTFSDIWGPE